MLHRQDRTRWFLGVAACLALATSMCRLGGPDELATTPDAGVAPALAPSSPPGPEAGEADTSTPGPDAGSPVDAGPTDARAQADAVADADPIVDGACAPPFSSAVCDPVCNTGCNTLARCDVADTPRTGRCIGIWIGREGDLCTSTALTNTCAPRLTCHDGKCLRLCYRNGDCENGLCCTVPIDMGGAPSGFKGCGRC